MPEHVHDKRCLSRAIICAVEDLRDDETCDKFAFQLMVGQNTLLDMATGYIDDGLISCTCEDDNE